MEESLDNRPIAVRRKRRSNSSLVSPMSSNNIHNNEFQPEVEDSPPVEVKTPTKPKKKVRFSDPGPEIIDSESTSLTPYLKRSKISSALHSRSSPKQRPLIGRAGRRRSLPSNLSSSSPSSCLSTPATPYISGEVQFVSIRQALDPRTKRKLRRNNMSEEINNIDAEKKSQCQLKQEIQGLKDELALSKQLENEVSDAPKEKETRNERVQELEEEIATLRQEMREKSIVVDSQSVASLPSTETPVSSIYGDSDANDQIMVEILDENRETRGYSSNEIAHVTTAEATTQVSLPYSIDMTAFRSARLALEYIFPGENTLGLAIEDPVLIINKLLDHLRSIKARAVLAENAASTSKNQEANLRSQFNAVLQQLDRARTQADVLSARILSEKARGDGYEKKVQRSEISVELGTKRVEGLEADVDEKQRSIEKLQEALNSYRVEVSKLEKLITKLEQEHSVEKSKFKQELEEAVLDLECQVAAETTGRRAAESVAVERSEKIKHMESMESELKGAVNEKQQIIRDMESEIRKEKDGREKEIGIMNVQISELTTSLEEAVSDLAKIEAEKKILLDRIEEEKAAGIRAVEAVQSEMARCVEKIEGVKELHTKDVQSRGAEAAEHRGLLTPVTDSRFKDVEGYVQVRRGKSKARKRPDSGIGILEEHEDEEMVVDDG